jgi:DNA-binding MarR family transcriptional regulator
MYKEPGAPLPDGIDETIQAWRYERPDLPLDATEVISRIWFLARIFGDFRRKTLADANIDPAVLDLLSVLRRSGHPHRLTTRELTRRSLVTAGATSQRLVKAEEAGLVSRTTATDGSRLVFVELTNEGIETVDRYVDVVMRSEHELLAAIPDTSMKQLASLLREVVQEVRPWSDTVPRTQVRHERPSPVTDV